MTEIKEGRWTVDTQDDFVVFLIGMRINKLWKVWKWLPVMTAMPRMLAELGKRPELGLIHARTYLSFRSPLVVQYWKSADLLHAYATNPDNEHLPAWKAFNKAIGASDDVGIWHETYPIKAGACRNIYGNMPVTGLGHVGTLKEAQGFKLTGGKSKRET